jgi:hypothetical protein
MHLSATQKKIGLLALAAFFLSACQTMPAEKHPQSPLSAEEFKPLLKLTESQFLRVEPILTRFLSGQKAMSVKAQPDRENKSGGPPAGNREKSDRLAQLAAQELKPYLTPAQLTQFKALTQGGDANSGSRREGRHGGSGGGMGHDETGNMGF